MGLFSKKKPELQDEALADLALMFYADTEDPTVGSELLDAAKMDYTLESLKVVDAHLEHIRAQHLEDERIGKFILRCGAYVGEVVRRNSKAKTYHWLDNQGAISLDKKIAAFGDSLGTAAVLWDGGTGFSFPLGKVMKYLENGSEDSVYFFANVMLSKSDQE